MYERCCTRRLFILTRKEILLSITKRRDDETECATKVVSSTYTASYN